MLFLRITTCQFMARGGLCAMLMDARLFLCQGFVLLRKPNSIYWDDDAEYVPSCSGLLHLAQPGEGRGCCILESN